MEKVNPAIISGRLKDVLDNTPRASTGTAVLSFKRIRSSSILDSKIWQSLQLLRSNGSFNSLEFSEYSRIFTSLGLSQDAALTKYEFLTHFLPSIHDSIKSDLELVLSKQCSLCLSFDGWQDSMGLKFLAITAY